MSKIKQIIAWEADNEDSFAAYYMSRHVDADQWIEYLKERGFGSLYAILKNHIDEVDSLSVFHPNLDNVWVEDGEVKSCERVLMTFHPEEWNDLYNKDLALWSDFLTKHDHTYIESFNKFLNGE